MKNSLRVCMITPHFPPDFGWYGVGRNSMELAHVLNDHGHEVTIITCAEKGGTADTFQDGCSVTRVEWKKAPRLGSMAAHCMPRARLLMNMNIALWQAFLRVSKESQFDIIDVSGFSAESFIPSLLGDTPVFARIYESQPHFLEKELLTIGNSGFNFENHFKDTLGAISRGYASASKEESKTAELNYSLDTALFSPDGACALDTNNRPTVLVHTPMGNPEYQALLVEILSKVRETIPDLYLIVVAHDIYTESSEAEMKKVLSECGIECDMVINRTMSRLLMPGLWRSSRCGLLLDWFDFSPEALLEPLSCAVPVLANTKDINCTFLKDPSVLVQPSQFTGAGIAEKLIELLKDESLARKIGEKSRQYILANHCREKQGEELINAYRATIETYTQEKKRQEKINRLEKLLQHLGSLSDSFDKMLYDFLFLKSVRFRVSHWLRKLKGQPSTEPAQEVSKKV
ncbi:MAG: hypothetical protein C0469_11465 [Cyanobacteria bacterium DS2.3.42]|nr:hypothetical protein [Cyanobacteria bacterium DS2.3.42]